VEQTRSSNEYITRFSHPRLSSPTVSYEYVTPSSQGPPNHRQTISQRTTKMLVICSTTFLIFNSPYCAVLFYSIISKHVLTRTLEIAFVMKLFYYLSQLVENVVHKIFVNNGYGLTKFQNNRVFHVDLFELVFNRMFSFFVHIINKNKKVNEH
jgi:hypothetical protein